ncbi:hypothetical protein B0H11DRAFT_1932496 [Mycena galericulata]|nr:hypothetical protein B0H11DRAFT_1932496 [Mycena galericulata]
MTGTQATDGVGSTLVTHGYISGITAVVILIVSNAWLHLFWSATQLSKPFSPLVFPVYTYIITNFGNPDVLSHLVKTLVIEVFFENFIALAVQFFYCYRVFRLSNGNWAVSGCLISNPLLTKRFIKWHSWLTKIADLGAVKTLSMSCNIATAVTDVLITSVLIYYLATAKKGLKQTDHMINRLIAFTFNTGIPTSLCGVAACIAINVSPDTFIYMFWFIMFGRLYTNTLLVTLNTRNYIRSVGSGVHSFSLSPPSQCQFDVSPRGATGSTIEVRINTTQEEFQDQYLRESDGESVRRYLKGRKEKICIGASVDRITTKPDPLGIPRRRYIRDGIAVDQEQAQGVWEHGIVLP